MDKSRDMKRNSESNREERFDRRPARYRSRSPDEKPGVHHHKKRSRRHRSRTPERSRDYYRSSGKKSRRDRRSRERESDDSSDIDGLPIDEKEKPGSLPLNMRKSRAHNALRKSYDAKTKAMMGVTLPKYYNPTAINPIKFAEQIQKRKMLWQTKADPKVEQSKVAVWSKTTFSQDKDGSVSAKFKKLMGIKEEDPTVAPPREVRTPKDNEKILKDLDRQYEMARRSTHTLRGMGLGYASK